MMSDEDIDNANLEQPEKSQVAHFVWKYFAVQITPMLEKAAPRMQCACFVTKASLDAAPPEQQHIS